MDHLTKSLDKLNIDLGLKAQMKPLFNNYQHYVNQKQPNTWRSIIVTILGLYPENQRAQVVNLIQTGQVPSKSTAKPKRKTPMVTVEMKPSGEYDDGCNGCTQQKNKAVSLLDAMDASSVLNYFYAGVGEDKGKAAMKQWASMNSVKLNQKRLKDGEYIAGRLLIKLNAKRKEAAKKDEALRHKTPATKK